MLTNKKIKKLKYCRQCLNEEYDLRLQRPDVCVYYHPGKCRSCGGYRYIVHNVRRSRLWKLWLR